MIRITVLFFLLLCFLSSVCAFKNVFVVVVDNSTYLSSISGKGVLTNYNYGNQSASIASILKSKGVEWTVFADTLVNCKLPSKIIEKYDYLISFADAKSYGCAVSSSSFFNNVAGYNLEGVSFYFAEKGSDSNWLRSFLYPVFSSPKFLRETLTIIISQGDEDRIAPALLIGKDAQNPGRDQLYETEKLFATLNSYGLSLTSVPQKPSNAPWFDRIFYVLMENQPIKKALQYQHMRNLAVQGTLLTDFNALVNPSQPNYIGLTAGDMRGVTDDQAHDLTGRFIVDLLEDKDVSWKAYMEGYPGNCDNSPSYGRYVRKHNPFMSFVHVRENATLCDKIVNSDQLQKDIAANTLPRYTFYTPDMDNNGHDTGLKFSSRWLESFLAPLLQNQNFMERTLVVATYDEGIKPDNKIYTLLLGDMVPYGSLDNTSYTTYSLLRTTEDVLGLDNLGLNDANATVINPTNFYIGDLPPQTLNPFIFIGVGAGIVVSLTALGATVYYFRVVRNYKLRKQAVPLEESRSFLKDSTGSSEGDLHPEGERAV